MRESLFLREEWKEIYHWQTGGVLAQAQVACHDVVVFEIYNRHSLKSVINI